MSDTIERRSTATAGGTLHATTRDHGGGTTIGGLGIPVSVWSEDLGGFREQILPGAFTVSMKEHDIVAVSNHDTNYPLGRVSAGTLRLSEDERGVSYEVDLPNTERGREIGESVRRGDIKGNSWAMFVTDDTWTQTPEGLVRTVNQGILRELGPQLFPAYSQTTLDVRSLADTLAHGRRCVGSACTTRGQDPHVLSLELDLDQRGRETPGSDYSDVLQLERELDGRPQLKVAPALRREWPSQSEYTRLLGNAFTGRKVKATAYHEAGHAVHALLDGCRIDALRLLWTRDRNNGTWRFRGGECVTHGTDTAAMHLAGREATELAGLGEALPETWSAADHKRAHGCTKYGVLQDRQSARATLKRHWPAVQALATALLERQHIDGDTATSIIMGALDANTRHRLQRAA